MSFSSGDGLFHTSGHASCLINFRTLHAIASNMADMTTAPITAPGGVDLPRPQCTGRTWTCQRVDSGRWTPVPTEYVKAGIPSVEYESLPSEVSSLLSTGME